MASKNNMVNRVTVYVDMKAKADALEREASRLSKLFSEIDIGKSKKGNFNNLFAEYKSGVAELQKKIEESDGRFDSKGLKSMENDVNHLRKVYKNFMDEIGSIKELDDKALKKFFPDSLIKTLNELDDLASQFNKELQQMAKNNPKIASLKGEISRNQKRQTTLLDEDRDRQERKKTVTEKRDAVDIKALESKKAEAEAAQRAAQEKIENQKKSESFKKVESKISNAKRSIDLQKQIDQADDDIKTLEDKIAQIESQAASGSKTKAPKSKAKVTPNKNGGVSESDAEALLGNILKESEEREEQQAASKYSVKTTTPQRVKGSNVLEVPARQVSDYATGDRADIEKYAAEYESAVAHYTTVLKEIEKGGNLSEEAQELQKRISTEFKNSENRGELLAKQIANADSQVKHGFTGTQFVNSRNAFAKGPGIKTVNKMVAEEIESSAEKSNADQSQAEELRRQLEAKKAEKAAAKREKKKVDKEGGGELTEEEQQALDGLKALEDESTKAAQAVEETTKALEEGRDAVAAYDAELEDLKKADEEGKKEFDALAQKIADANAELEKISASEAGEIFNQLKQKASGIKLEGIDWSSIADMDQFKEAIDSNFEEFKRQAQLLPDAFEGIDINWEEVTDSNEFISIMSKMGDNWLNDFIPKIKGVKGLENIDWNSITSIEDLNQLMIQIEQQGCTTIRKGFDEVEREAQGMGEAVEEAADKLQGGNDQLEKTSETLRSLANVARKAVDFFGLTSGVNLLRKSVTKAYNTVKELDKAMTETAVVVPEFKVGDMWKRLPEYADIAKQYSSTLQDAYEVMTLYYQQGLETNQVFAVGQQTMKMARIAGLEYADATDRMTNALRGFNMEINSTNSQHVADVYSQLAAMSASNVEELSKAMTKTASLANSANMSFDNTAAFLAQIIETTRESAETAGTALKTVIARFSEVKSLFKEGDLVGDVDGEVVDVNKVGAALRAAGVDLNDFMTGAKGLDEIFIELAGKWDSLDLLTQRYIATMAAGSRQQSRFLALMSDNARLTELLSGAYNAAGASSEQFAKTEDSLQSKLNKLKTAWDEFRMGIANNKIIKLGVDILTGLLNIVNKFFDLFGKGAARSLVQLSTLIVGFVALRKTLKSLITTLTPGLAKFLGFEEAKNIKGIIKNLKEAFSKETVAVGVEPQTKGFMSKLKNALSKEKVQVPTEATSSTSADSTVAQSKGAEAASRQANAAAATEENSAIETNNALEGENAKATKVASTAAVQAAQAKVTEAQADVAEAKSLVEATEAEQARLITQRADLEQAKAMIMTRIAHGQALRSELKEQLSAAETEEQRAIIQGQLDAVEKQLIIDEAALTGVQNGLDQSHQALSEKTTELVLRREGLRKETKALTKAEMELKAAQGEAQSGMAATSGGLLSLLGTIWPVIVALGALAAAIAVAWHFSDENQTAQQIDLLSDAASQANETVGALNSTLSDLQNSWRGIQDGQETLQGLTRGTAEWYSQLLENNRAVQELASSFEDLTLKSNGEGMLYIDEDQYKELVKKQQQAIQQATTDAGIINSAYTYTSKKAESEAEFEDKVREEAGLYVGSGSGFTSWFLESVTDAILDSNAGQYGTATSSELLANARAKLADEEERKNQEIELQRKVAIENTAAALEAGDFDEKTGKSLYSTAAYKFAASKMYETNDNNETLIDQIMKEIPGYDKNHDFEITDEQLQRWKELRGYTTAGGKVFDQQGNEVDYKSKTAEIAYAWAADQAKQRTQGIVSNYEKTLQSIDNGKNLSKILSGDITANLDEEALKFGINSEQAKALGYDSVEAFQQGIQEKVDQIAKEQNESKLKGVEAILGIGDQLEESVSTDTIQEALNTFKKLSEEQSIIASEQMQDVAAFGSETLNKIYLENFDKISQNLSKIDTSSIAAIESSLKALKIDVDIPLIDKFNGFVKSGILEDLDESFDDIIKDNGALSPKSLIEMAKSSKGLATQLGYTTKEFEQLSRGEKVAAQIGDDFIKQQATGWARIINAVKQGKLAYADVNESLIQMASNGRNSTDVLTELQEHINNFNPGISNTIGYDFYSEAVETMKDMADNANWGDQTFENYILDSFDIDPNTLVSNTDIKKYYKQLSKWDANNGKQFWKDTGLDANGKWLQNDDGTYKTTDQAIEAIKKGIKDTKGKEYQITDQRAEAELQNFLAKNASARKLLQASDIFSNLDAYLGDRQSQNISEEELNRIAALNNVTAKEMKAFIDSYNTNNANKGGSGKNIQTIDQSQFYDKSTGNVLTGQELLDAIKSNENLDAFNVDLIEELIEKGQTNKVDVEKELKAFEAGGLNKEVAESLFDTLVEKGVYKPTKTIKEASVNSKTGEITYKDVTIEGESREEVERKAADYQQEQSYKKQAQAIVDAFSNAEADITIKEDSLQTVSEEVDKAVNGEDKKGKTVEVTATAESTKPAADTIKTEVATATEAAVGEGLNTAATTLPADYKGSTVGEKVFNIFKTAVEKGFSTGLSNAKLSDEGKQALKDVYGKVFGESVNIGLQLDAEKTKKDVSTAVSNGIGEVKTKHLSEEEKTIIKGDIISSTVEGISNALTNIYNGFNEASQKNFGDTVVSGIKSGLDKTTFTVPIKASGTYSLTATNGTTPTITLSVGKNGTPLQKSKIETTGPLFGRYANGGATRSEMALVGEEGEELIQLKRGGAYLAGQNGPEMVQLSRGDIVYSNPDTQEIFKRGGDLSQFNRYAKGTGKLTNMLMRKLVEQEQKAYSAGGNVDLNDRPIVPGEVMMEAGWGGSPDSYSTVLTNSYTSDKDGSVINVTPIKKNGEVLNPYQLDDYGYDLANEKISDFFELQIGPRFYGKDAEKRAGEVGEKIHLLQAAYYDDVYDEVQFVLKDQIQALKYGQTLENYLQDELEGFDYESASFKEIIEHLTKNNFGSGPRYDTETFANAFSDARASNGSGNQYGQKVNNSIGWHRGVDLHNGGGPIPSISSGKVITAVGSYKQGDKEANDGWGNQVVIEDEAGNRFYYSHLKNLAVNSGQTVEPGQIIGTEGSTGNSTGSHLDFMIQTPNGYVNPRDFINGKPLNNLSGNHGGTHGSSRRSGGGHPVGTGTGAGPDLFTALKETIFGSGSKGSGNGASYVASPEEIKDASKNQKDNTKATEKNTKATQDLTNVQRQQGVLQKELSELQEGGVWTSPWQLANLRGQKQLLDKEYKVQKDLLKEKETEYKNLKKTNKEWKKYIEEDPNTGEVSYTDEYQKALDSGLLSDSDKDSLAKIVSAGNEVQDQKNVVDEYPYKLDEIGDQRDDIFGQQIDQGVDLINQGIANMGTLANAAIQMFEKLAQTAVDAFISYLGWLTIRFDDEHDIGQLDTSLQNSIDRLNWEYEKLLKRNIAYETINSMNQRDLFENSNETARDIITRIQNQRQLYQNSFRQLEDLGLNIGSELTEAFESLYDKLYGPEGPFTKLNKRKRAFERQINELTPAIGSALGEANTVITGILSNIGEGAANVVSKLFPNSVFATLKDDLKFDGYELGDFGKDKLQRLIEIFTELTPSFNADYQIANKSELVDGLKQKLSTIITKDTITVQFIQGYLDYLTEVESQMEGEVENIRNSEKEILDLYDNLTEILERGKDQYEELEQQLYDAIVDSKNSLLEELQALHDSISNADSDLLDTLKKNLDLIRQQRENNKTEEDLQAKEARLAYLRQDTSGANLQEILKLEKELEEGQESYTDKLIDQKISQLQEQNEEAAKQRQIQIDLLQAEIDNTKDIWDKVKELLLGVARFDKYLTGEIDREGYSNIINALKDTKSFKESSAYQQENSEKEWDTLIRGASLYQQVKDNLEDEYRYLKLATAVLDRDTGLPEDYAANQGWHNYVAFSNLETTIDRSNSLLKEAIAAINNVVDKITISYNDEMSLHMKTTYYGGLIQAISGTEDAAKKTIENIASGAPGILQQVTTGTGNIAKGMLKMGFGVFDSAESGLVSMLSLIPEVLGTGGMGGGATTTLGDIGEGVGMLVEGVSNLAAAAADAGALGMQIIGDAAPGFADIGVAIATSLKETFSNDYVRVNNELSENIEALIDNMGDVLGKSGYLKEIKEGIKIAQMADYGAPQDIIDFKTPIYQTIEDEYKDIISDYQRLLSVKDDYVDIEGFNSLYTRIVKLKEIVNHLADEVGDYPELDPSESLESVEHWRGEIGSLFQKIGKGTRDIVVSIVNGILGKEGMTLGDKRIGRWIDLYDEIIMLDPNSSTLQSLADAMQTYSPELSNKLFKLYEKQYEKENTPQETMITFWEKKLGNFWNDLHSHLGGFFDGIKNFFTDLFSKIFNTQKDDKDNRLANGLEKITEHINLLGRGLGLEMQGNTETQTKIGVGVQGWLERIWKVISGFWTSFLGLFGIDDDHLNNTILGFFQNVFQGAADIGAQIRAITGFGTYETHATGGTINRNQTALVGEAGAELIQHAKGGATLASGPAMAKLQKGDVVYNASQTKQILKGKSLDFRRFAEGTVDSFMFRDPLTIGVASIPGLPPISETGKESTFNLNLSLEDLTVDSPDRVEQVANRVMEKITTTVNSAIWPYNKL